VLFRAVDKLILSRKIGERVVDIRKEKRMSQRDLAFACGKDPQSIERVENGKSCPTVWYLFELSQVLEVSLSEFFDEGKLNL
jgi:transcriptional regulator with XRE-family HTH domain